MRARLARARPKSYVNFGEIGRSGLSQWGGEIREEFLPEMKGRQGRKNIREMEDNDPIIGAILFAISMLIRQAKPIIKPATEDEGQKREAADFVQSCLNDMSETWSDTITEILTMLPYGWAWMETVYKRRGGPSNDPTQNSRFTDGRIGWRKMPLRGQNTLKKWVFDKQGGIQAMVQQVQGEPEREISIRKSLLFRTMHNKNNPEGKSVLRNVYRPWYFKKRIEEIEGIGIERDLAGLPVMTAPEGVDLWNQNDTEAQSARQEAELIVRQIRRDEQEGVLLPHGWELALLSSAGKRNFDTTTVIGRYNNNIAMTMLADFIVLGHNNRYGSFALSSNKTHMFAVALGGWLQSIAEVFNRYAIPRLLEINSMPLEHPPVMEFEDIELPDLDELGTYIYKLSQAGFQLFPNIPLEKKLLGAASMPVEDMELGRDPVEHARQMAEATAVEKPEEDEEESPNGPNAQARGSQRTRPTSKNRPDFRGTSMRARVTKKRDRWG